MRSDLEQLRFLTPTLTFQVVSKFATPTYVCDENTLVKQARTALGMPCAFGKLSVHYAMKANPNPEILKLFKQEGITIDASSEFEAKQALELGYKPKDITITSQQFPKNTETLRRGVNFNACSLHQLRRYGELFPNTSVGVRFNPGIGSGHSAKTNVGGPSASFGIWHEYASEVQTIAEEFDLTIVRLHSHIGSGADAEVWTRAARLTLNLAAEFPDVNTIDLGGGFKPARMKTEIEADLHKIGQAIKTEFESFAKKTGRQLQLAIEPGAFLVANGVAIVSEVIDIKDTGPKGHKFIVVDTGMTENLRFSLYGAQHPLVVVPKKPSQSHAQYVVVGHNCESGDLLTPKPGDPEAISERLLQKPQIGDLLVIEACGAYCASMNASGYNSFPRAKEVLLTSSGNLLDISYR